MTPQRFPFALSVPGFALLSLALLSFAISPILATTAKAKPTCAIVGDSIAAGAGKYVSGCRVNAKIGIPSGAVIPRVDPSAEIGERDSKEEFLQRVVFKGPFPEKASFTVGIPEDIAAMVAFLLSDDAAYVNGQTIHVDGGGNFA